MSKSFMSMCDKCYIKDYFFCYGSNIGFVEHRKLFIIKIISKLISLEFERNYGLYIAHRKLTIFNH